MSSKTICYNKRAKYEYFLLEEMECGIALLGSEVKSLRDGKVNISDAHAHETKGEIYLSNLSIAKYSHGSQYNHEEKRPRKLLLHKNQISKIIGKIKTKGITLVPISLYFNKKNIVKVNLAIAKGKKLYDKREVIKKRDQLRQQRREEH